MHIARFWDRFFKYPVHAERALAEARSSGESGKDVWIKTWIEILAQQAGARS